MNIQYLELLVSAPNTQICKSIRNRLAKLPQSVVQREDLEYIMDDCVKYSLASEFAMGSLEYLYESIKSTRYIKKYGTAKYTKENV